MIKSKNLVSGIVASMIVAGVGLAYAQTTTDPATSSSTATQESQPSSTPSSSMSSDTSSTPSDASTSTPAPQADRN